VCFFFQAEDGIRDWSVTGVQTCALPISDRERARLAAARGALAPRLPAGARLAGGAPVRALPGAARLGGRGRVNEAPRAGTNVHRSEERRVGKGCRSRWARDE